MVLYTCNFIIVRIHCVLKHSEFYLGVSSRRANDKCDFTICRLLHALDIMLNHSLSTLSIDYFTPGASCRQLVLLKLHVLGMWGFG